MKRLCQLEGVYTMQFGDRMACATEALLILSPSLVSDQVLVPTDTTTLVFSNAQMLSHSGAALLGFWFSLMGIPVALDSGRPWTMLDLSYLSGERVRIPGSMLLSWQNQQVVLPETARKEDL